MSQTAGGKAETQSPQIYLIQMATAHWVSSFLYAAAKMNLADQLAERAKTIEELAQSTGTAAPSLYRMMRTLASLGLFTEDSEHRFALTRLGEPLGDSRDLRSERLLVMANAWLALAVQREKNIDTAPATDPATSK